MVEEVSAGAAGETEEEVRNEEELGLGLTLGRRGRGSRCRRRGAVLAHLDRQELPLPGVARLSDVPNRLLGLLVLRHQPGFAGTKRAAESVFPDSPPPHGAKVSKLLDGSSEFSLTYEDKDGDWMLVGDVPRMINCTLVIVHAFNFVAILCLTYGMVLETVKRLRIMRKQMGCQSVHFGELDLNAAPGFQSLNKASEAIGSSPGITAGNRMRYP
ncbi:unnamed protein product [Musa acuminata subsp. burmannicoides]